MIHTSSYFNIQNLFYLKEFLQASPSTLNAQKITKMTGNNGNFVGSFFAENIKQNSEVMEVQIRTLKTNKNQYSKDGVLKQVLAGL